MTKFKDLNVSVGIDVHKKQWNVAIYANRCLHKRFQQPPSGQALSNYLTKHFPGATYKSAYEAGCLGFQPHRELTVLGIDNIVVNPADVPTTDKEKKRKRDAIDSVRIGRGLVNGELEAVNIPTPQEESDRKIVRIRTSILRSRLTKSKQRIKDFLLKTGMQIPDQWEGNNWGRAFIDWLENLEYPEPSNRVVLDLLLDDLRQAKEQQHKVDREIVKLSKTEPYANTVARLRTIPGIGLLTAMVLVTELIDMERFDSNDKLASFCGIAPDVSSSDQKEKVKGLTKRTNSELRRIIIQASWIAKNKDPDLLMSYQNLTKRMMGQEAIIRIARKLLNRVRYVWLNECDYKIPR